LEARLACNPAWHVATVGISKDRTVSGVHTTTECDGAASVVVAIRDFHAVARLPDGLSLDPPFR
jgi:hypothetical protein